MSHTISRSDIDQCIHTTKIGLASADARDSRQRKWLSWMPYHCVFTVTAGPRDVYSGNDLDAAIAAYNEA